MAPMISAADVARLLGISTRAVYDLVASGRLAAYRIGRAVRFEVADVEAFKASCRVDATPLTRGRTASGRPPSVAIDAGWNASGELRKLFESAKVPKRKPRLARPHDAARRSGGRQKR